MTYLAHFMLHRDWEYVKMINIITDRIKGIKNKYFVKNKISYIITSSK